MVFSRRILVDRGIDRLLRSTTSVAPEVVR